MSNITKIGNITIAVVGKGGAGKTTCAYLLARHIIARGIKPLLIDADPTMSHFARVLGLAQGNSIESIRDRLIKTAAIGTPTEKEFLAQNLDNIVEQSLQHHLDYSLLIMGQPERSGCFCPSNSLLRSIIETISGRFPVVLIDCEAGLEQIHRNVISKVDYLVIVSDSSLRSLETAEKILESAKKFTHYQDVGLILNKVKENHFAHLESKIQTLNVKLLGLVPEDENIVNLELMGQSLENLALNSKSFIAIDKIVEKILNLNPNKNIS